VLFQEAFRLFARVFRAFEGASDPLFALRERVKERPPRELPQDDEEQDERDDRPDDKSGIRI
jgi:hypothetical protein